MPAHIVFFILTRYYRELNVIVFCTKLLDMIIRSELVDSQNLE